MVAKLDSSMVLGFSGRSAGGFLQVLKFLAGMYLGLFRCFTVNGGMRMTVASDTFGDAASALMEGRACIFPTDTVYGLGVSVLAASGPDVLFDIKQRDAGKPIAWLVGSVDDLRRYGKNLPPAACELAQRFWPGALTIIVEASDAVPRSFRSKSGTIGLRMPANDTALALIRHVGSPLVTTSANISGNAAVSRFEALDSQLFSRVGCALRDPVESMHSGLASTVIDCTGGALKLLREGGISFEEIRSHS